MAWHRICWKSVKETIASPSTSRQNPEGSVAKVLMEHGHGQATKQSQDWNTMLKTGGFSENLHHGEWGRWIHSPLNSESGRWTGISREGDWRPPKENKNPVGSDNWGPVDGKTVYRAPTSLRNFNQLVNMVTHFSLYLPFKIYHVLGSWTTQTCIPNEGGPDPASHPESPILTQEISKSHTPKVPRWEQ